MEAPPKIGQKRLLPAAVASLMFLGAVAVLFFFNPTEYHFYPRCPLYQLTGLLCPGCGALRATHQLSHGHIAAAFHLNPLLVILSPLAAWLGLRWVVWQLTGKQWPAVVAHRWWPWIFIAVLLVFGIARNLPLF